MAIKFEKEYADDKTCTLITIDERVILHNTGGVLSCKLDNIGALVATSGTLIAIAARPALRER